MALPHLHQASTGESYSASGQDEPENTNTGDLAELVLFNTINLSDERFNLSFFQTKSIVPQHRPVHNQRASCLLQTAVYSGTGRA